jgi:hypothetical protein
MLSISLKPSSLEAEAEILLPLRQNVHGKSKRWGVVVELT